MLEEILDMHQPIEPALTTTFLTVDAIVNDLISKMDASDRHFIRKLKKAEIGQLHHGFGTEIRNHYELWHPKHPLTYLNHQEVIIDNVDHSPTHPDAVSMEIIKLLHRKLQYIS
jgi:hypothetical protein